MRGVSFTIPYKMQGPIALGTHVDKGFRAV